MRLELLLESFPFLSLGQFGVKIESVFAIHLLLIDHEQELEV